MQLTTKCLNNLQTPPKTQRTRLQNTNIYVEQSRTGFSLSYRYQSPITFKYRLIKLKRFNYSQTITANNIKNIKKQAIIYDADIIKGIDPLDKKQNTKKAELDAKGKNVTLNHIFNQYNESKEFEGYANSTQSTYLSIYNIHIKPTFGSKSVQSYSRGKIQLFLETKSAGIQHICLALFCNIEKYLLKHDIITSHRLIGLKTHPMGKRRKSISDETIVQLLTSLDKNNPIHSAIHFQLLTACRINEVLTLKWDTIDFKNKTVTINWKNIKTERKSAVVHRDHTLPITAQMTQVLLLMKQYGSTGYVFKSNYKGKKINPCSINNVLKPFNCTSHILRKTCATAIFSTLELGSTELQLILNHVLVSGSDKEYISSDEQFLPRKLKTLKAWHNHLDSLINSELVKEA